MEELILFLFTFIICFLGRLIIYLVSKMNKKDKKKKKNKEKNKPKSGIAVEIYYLSTKFKIPLNNLDNKGFGALISMLDALIISGTISLVVMITSSITLELLLGLLIVIALIYICYEIVGRILVWKGYDKK